ncbi:helix-turn-helix domain-containing protein [Rhodoferax sp. UBA5149]|uniref:helix-turn-helix domain-containing protein n=1 Tax=Rhodoferax sp. UBA5149 TaxID=1947379 RepID=UPI0025EEE89C|nr:helix-turn-helix domain-containing protein [Rhodoferax sp. UBA5149]
MALQTRMDSGTPHQLFFTTPEQRIALARQRFFEEGTRPSGMVAEPVIQSWMRCTTAHAPVSGGLVLDPVTPSRLHGALNRNRELLAVARQELTSMENSLSGTDCQVLLTDGEGIIVHATHNPHAARASILQKATRLGVNISESAIGTTAPGIVTKTGHACMVLGAEHFHDCLQGFHCAAAPIRDVTGRLAAVLNLSIESRSFGFDAASVIGLYATSIENSLLQAQSRELLLLQFQASPTLLGTPMEALAGITSGGNVAWLNVVAARLLGQQADALPQTVEAVFGLSLAALLRFVRYDNVEAIRLPSGLGVWLKARIVAADGADFKHAIALPPPPAGVTATLPPSLAPSDSTLMAADDATLGEHSRKFIEDTLAACGGNISRAAKTLRVSRGTLYRRLKAWRSKTNVISRSC